MTGSLLSPCRRHRAALVDFVDRGEIEPRTRAALAHLEVCRTCEIELERTAQAITALRRLGLEAAMAEPSADVWPRLRARVTSPSVGGMRWGSGLGATVVGAALVAAIGLPFALRQAGGLGVSPSTNDISALIQRAEQAAEKRYLRALPHAPSTAATEVMAAPRRTYPDDWRPPARSQMPPPRID